MRSVSMSEFRRTAGQLARAGETVVVTVNNYPVATWNPITSRAEAFGVLVEEVDRQLAEAATILPGRPKAPSLDAWTAIHPVPKPTRRRK